MAYDDPIVLSQGSPKLSEIACDREQPVIEMPEHASALAVVEQLRKVATDALTRVNYILHSDGQIRWDGDTLHFDSDVQTNDIIFKLLQTEAAVPRTFNFNLRGSITGNDVTKFQNISLADRELLYLEIDRSELFSTPSGEIDVENATDGPAGAGGSLTPGRTLKKVALSAVDGMPALTSPLTGATLTLSIPLCMRWDWSDGVNTYKDIWWIPHGIRWPEDVTSTLGAVVAKGLEFYPTYFVHTVSELTQAIALTDGPGGVICIVDPIVIDSSFTIPSGATLLGRSGTDDPSNKSSITLLPGGRIDIADGAIIKDMTFFGSGSFGATATEYMVHMNGGYGRIENCSFVGANTTGTSYGIRVASNNNQIKDCHFATAQYRYGIWYYSGVENIDSNCRFDNGLYAHIFESSISKTTSGSVDSSVLRRTIGASPPPGSIIAFMGGYFTANDSTGFVSTINTATAINSWLETNGYHNWKACNGAPLNDPESPFWNAGGRYLPLIADNRFIMGNTAAGLKAGTNSSVHLHSVPIHGHSFTQPSAHTVTQPVFYSKKHYHSPGSLYVDATKGSHIHAGSSFGVTRGGNSGTGRELAVGDSNDFGMYYPSVSILASLSEHGHENTTMQGWVGKLAAQGGSFGDGDVTCGQTTLTAVSAHTGGAVIDKAAFNTVNAGDASGNMPQYLSAIYIVCTK